MNTRFHTSLSIDEHFLSDNKGLFLIPSESRPEGDEWIVTCANEYGKLEYTDVNGFLGLSDLDYNEIKISFPKNNQVLTYCENNKWMNRDPPPPLKDTIYYVSDGVLKPCPNVSLSGTPKGLSVKGTLSVDSIRMTNDKYCGTIVIDCSGELEYNNFGKDVLNIIHYTGEYITNGIPSIQKTKNGFKIINLGTNKLKGQVTVCYLKIVN